MLLKCNQYRDDLAENLKKTCKINGISVFIQVGDNPASTTYINQKGKACNKAGIQYNYVVLDKNITEEQLIAKIEEYNNSVDVVGIMVQLPLPSHINEDAVINAIKPEKDIDGFTHVNKGKLMVADESVIVPCTPYGIDTLLESINFDCEGKNVVVVGRSNIVGKPMTQLLINRGATVTCCNSKTSKETLTNLILNSDLFISAIDKPDFFDIQYFGKDNLAKLSNIIAIDVGIFRILDKLHGNINKELYDYFKAITPVPGGVGPMTITGVLSNIIKCASLQDRLEIIE